tara:strand:- start:212 stop:898 length:687 start_codon:yes stop_codon:yes gene_type:complete
MKDFIYEYQIPDQLCDDLIKLHSEIPWLSDEVIKDELTDLNYPMTKGHGKTGSNRVFKHIKDSIDVSIMPQAVFNPISCNKVYWPYIEVIKNYKLHLDKATNEYFYELGYMDGVFRNEVGVPMTTCVSLNEALNIQRYEPGGGYHVWHMERSPERTQREFVWMTYLNDVPDGGTEFYYQKRTEKAVKGKTLLWPAGYTHVHKGQISKKHIKYIITGWLSFNDINAETN